MSTPARRKATATPARLRRSAHGSDALSVSREASTSTPSRRVVVVGTRTAATAAASPARAGGGRARTTAAPSASPQRVTGAANAQATSAKAGSAPRAPLLSAAPARPVAGGGGVSYRRSVAGAPRATAALHDDRLRGHPAAPLPLRTTTTTTSATASAMRVGTRHDAMTTAHERHARQRVSGAATTAASVRAVSMANGSGACASGVRAPSGVLDRLRAPSLLSSLPHSSGVAASPSSWAMTRRDTSLTSSTAYATTALTAHNNNNARVTTRTSAAASAVRDTAAVSLGEDLHAASVYRVAYTLQQSALRCVAVSTATATVWAGNGVDGNVYLYNALTGELAHTLLPPPATTTTATTAGTVTSYDAATMTRRGSLGSSNKSPAATPRAMSAAHHAHSNGNSSSSAPAARPCALHATSTHMWVGYDTGAVAVYDALVLRCVTRGRFHAAPLVGFALVFDNDGDDGGDDDGDDVVAAGGVYASSDGRDDDDGVSPLYEVDTTVRGIGTSRAPVAHARVVSAARDGTLALWDSEARGFECVVALPSAPAPLRTEGGLTCVRALGNAHTSRPPARRRPPHDDIAPSTTTTTTRAAAAASTYRDADDDDKNEDAAAATTPVARVLCGFASGALAVLQLTSIDACVCALLRGVHTQHVNAIAVVGPLVFTAAEDEVVAVWSRAALRRTQATTTTTTTTNNNNNSSSSSAACLVQRIPVRPAVRALLSCTRPCGGSSDDDNGAAPRSLWVAYADGLIERWSAHVEDGFAVEEVVRAALHVVHNNNNDNDNKNNSDDDDENEGDARDTRSRHDGGDAKAAAAAASASRAMRRHAAAAAPHASPSTSKPLPSMTTMWTAAHARGVLTLCALGATATLRVLALSSSGVNTVWYTHHNHLEQRLQHSVAQLQRVIARDVDDAAAWRERVALLMQKELERKRKYAVLLEQLHELQLLWRYCEQWRRHVVAHARPQRDAHTLACTLHDSAQLVLRQRYYRAWLHAYAMRQRRGQLRRLADAMASASWRAHARLSLSRWHAARVRASVRQQLHDCVDVLARTAHVVLLTRYYHAWRRRCGGAVVAATATTTTAAAAPTLLSADQLQLLAVKAQRQTLRRALHTWYDAYATSALRHARAHSDSSTCPATATASAAVMSFAPAVLQRYACVCARDSARRHAAMTWQRWRAWATRQRRLHVLRAVATLQAQQRAQLQQHDAYLRWAQYVRTRQLAQRAAAMRDVELRVRRLEAEHGDVFDRLQLQRQLERLREQHAQATAQLRDAEARVRALQSSCAALRRRDADDDHRDNNNNDDNNNNNDSNSTARRQPSLPTGQVTTTTATAAWHAHLIEQQHLSPAVLQRLSLAEALPHVVAQLKGNVLNLYTDLPLFRLLSDRRRGGTSAVALFTEAFAEVKRAVVTVLHTPLVLPATTTSFTITNSSSSSSATTALALASAAHVRNGNAAAQDGSDDGDGDGDSVRTNLATARWPLSLAAVDSVPLHLCAGVLSAIKAMLVAYDLLTRSELDSVTATCLEVVANADWLLLLARACHARRRPMLPVNNRQA